MTSKKLKDAEFFEKGAHTKKLKVNAALDTNSIVNIVKVTPTTSLASPSFPSSEPTSIARSRA